MTPDTGFGYAGVFFCLQPGNPGQWCDMRTLKYKTPKDMQGVIDAYFAECVANEQPPTMTGLGLALDIDRSTLLRYGERDAFCNTVKRAKARVTHEVEKILLTGKGATAGAIFWLKNNASDWRDKSEQEITGKDGGAQEFVVRWGE